MCFLANPLGVGVVVPLGGGGVGGKEVEFYRGRSGGEEKKSESGAKSEERWTSVF